MHTNLVMTHCCGRNARPCSLHRGRLICHSLRLISWTMPAYIALVALGVQSVKQVQPRGPNRPEFPKCFRTLVVKIEKMNSNST